eukprot:TRINITY_DN8918_c0_g1_i1.p1 TRINITY_DN8918_c0_g1~~TRINITY_DN8918_c0_g1_i1.p1  ORF type:complete len:294 (+),score=34.62 TRINITY_DN8918_c0_g1_i1:39-884(+)
MDTDDSTALDDSLDVGEGFSFDCGDETHDDDEGPSQRILRIRSVAAARLGGFRLVLEGVNDHGNRAALLRTAESFGLLHIHELKGPAGRSGAAATSSSCKRSKNRSIVNGAEKWLDLHQHESPAECAAALHDQGFVLLAAVPPEVRTVGASAISAVPSRASPTPLENVDFGRKTALVFGSEGYGISSDMLSACDGSFTIPIVGFTESLNISVAAAVCCHFGRLKRLASLGLTAQNEGDLSVAEASELGKSYERRNLEHNFTKAVRSRRAKIDREEGRSDCG